MATTLRRADGRTGLPANLGILREERVGRERPVFPGVRRTVLLEPGHRTGDPLLELHGGLVPEELARLRQVGNVVRDLAEQRRRKRDLRLDAELGRDQLGGMDERVAVAVGEVDRLVHDAPLGERLDALRDSLDAVVDVGEVEGLLLSEHRHRLVAEHRVDEQRQHAHHAGKVVVVAPVDVREAEDEIAQAVATRIRVDKGLTCDLRRGIRGLRVREVGARLARLPCRKPVHVAIDLPTRRKDDGKILLAAELQDVEGHDRVFEGAVRLAHELMHLRVRGEMHHEIDVRVLHPADASREGRVVPGEILQEITEVVRPGVQPLVDPEDLVSLALQTLAEVRPDLAARPGDEDPHQAATGTACTPRKVVDVASSSRTSTRSPATATPEKLTVVLRRVRPRSRLGSVRLGLSTRTSSTRPTRPALREAATCCTTSISRSMRSCFTSSGICSVIAAASVPARGEYTNVYALSKPTSSTADIVSRRSSSVSPGKPTIRSVVSARSGIASRSSATSRR